VLWLKCCFIKVLPRRRGLGPCSATQLFAVRGAHNRSVIQSRGLFCCRTYFLCTYVKVSHQSVYKLNQQQSTPCHGRAGPVLPVPPRPGLVLRPFPLTGARCGRTRAALPRGRGHALSQARRHTKNVWGHLFPAFLQVLAWGGGGFCKFWGGSLPSRLRVCGIPSASCSQPPATLHLHSLQR